MSQTIPGSLDADTLMGRADLPDEILGDDGDDSIEGLGAGTGEADRLFGEAGDDTILSNGTGFAYLDGGTGNDSLVAGAEGINSVVGAAGDDTVIGSDSTDYIAGDDYDLFGAGPSTASGNDVIDGGNGDDVISGGPGDDTLSPGAAGTGFDQVIGGDGNDVLALEGAPQDYAIDPFTNFLVSIPTTGPGSGVRADVQDVEQVAFGVTSLELANGAVPLTLVDWVAMFDGLATNSGIGRPHSSLSDTVQGARGAQTVAISIADLLANDFDPDGDALTFVALNATATTGINTFLVFTDPADITNEGYDPADFPEGLLLAFLDNPLTGPLTFTYRTQMTANGVDELGSTATVTIDPGAPPPPPAAVGDALRGTIGGQDVVLASVLLGNDIGPLTFTGLDGMVPDPNTPDAFLLDTFDPVTGLRDASLRVVIDTSDPAFSRIFYSGFDADFTFTYLAEDVSGNSVSATVTVTVDNEKPVAANQSVIVTAGVPTRIQLGDIVAGAGNLDPDGDPLILASYSFLDPAFGTLQGFGPADPSDPNDFGSIEVTLNPGVTGASIQYGIIDEPNLGGAKPDIQNTAFATLNFVTTAPPPPPPEIAFAAADVGATPEGTPGVPGAGGGVLFFTLARSGDPAAVFTVDLRLSGTADGSDFAGIVGATQQADPELWRVAFAAGQGSATIEVFVQPDDILEPDETVTFTIEAATGATPSATGALAASGTILNDDPGNAAPVASDFTRALDEDFLGSLFSLGALTTDPDNNAIAWAITSVVGVTLTGFDPQSGLGAITSIPNFNGQARIDWTVTDAGGLSDSASYFIDIAPVNDAPVFVVDASVNISAGQTATIIGASLLANDTDADGDPLSILQFSDTTTAGGTVANTAFDTFVYTPPIGFTGTDTVSYVISDGFGGTADATLTINVAPPINQAPTDIALSKTTVGSNRPAGTLVGTLAATDPDIGDTLSFSFVPGGNPGGRFAIDGDALETAIPLPFPAGAARQVTLRVTDQDGAFHDETFVIVIGRDRTGSDGTDTLAGGPGDDRLRALGGNDRVMGRAGDDSLEGGEGHDTLFGDTGADTLSGGEGDDRLLGGAGNDLMAGGAGNDLLAGSSGDDSLDGGLGADILVGGTGADTIAGGGDDGTATMIGTGASRRMLTTNGDVIDLRVGGAGDGEADRMLYAAGTDGVDLLLGFEAGIDVLEVALNGHAAMVQELLNGTWVGFAGDPGGVLLLGAKGLSLGTDILLS